VGDPEPVTATAAAAPPTTASVAAAATTIRLEPKFMRAMQPPDLKRSRRTDAAS
jgi:hypothetical protein